MTIKSSIRSMETGLSYKTALSGISDVDSYDYPEADSKSKGKLIATVIPKEFQDYNSKNLHLKEYKIEERRMVRDICNLSVAEDHDQKKDVDGFSFDTIIDEDRNINDLIISLDLELPNIDDNEVIIVHMNREPMEMAKKTLKRLELSATKRIVQVLDPKHRKSLGKKGKSNKKDEETLKCQVFFRTESSGGVHESEMDVKGHTTYELFDMIANKNKDVHNTNSYSGMRLTVPKSYKQNFDSNEIIEWSEMELNIISNPPTILTVQTFESFASKLYANVPLTIQTEIIHASKAIVSWFLDEELVLHDSHHFVPDPSHVGKKLSVLVTPFLRGCPVGPNSEAYTYANAIEPLPFMPILSPLRDEFTKVRRTKNAFKDYVRVVTYNILADLYVSCSRGNIDQRMVYPHTDYEYLKRSRRMPMILAEILSYQADVICLQEVDRSVYETYLEPAMHAMGYDGFYSNKASSQPEGCAIFWLTCVFEGVDRLTVTLRDLFDEDDFFNDCRGKKDNFEIKPEFKRWDSMRGIQKLLRNNKELKKVTMEKVGQILQIATLKLKGDRENKPGHVLIANTHLFYHPLADHIRAIQTYVVCKKIDEVRRIPRDEEVSCPLILCGDLNSDPLSGASQLLFSRSVEPGHRDCWKNLHVYKWEYGDESYLLEHEYIGNDVGAKDLVWEEEQFMDAKENETVNFKRKKPPTISLPDSFPTLVSGCLKIPEFTNYAVDFAETLDYVLASEPSETELHGFVPLRDARFPSTEEMKQFVAMPNKFMPSDHVSVVCDLQWRRYNGDDEVGKEGEELN